MSPANKNILNSIMQKIIFVSLIAASFILGQQSIMHAYNPRVLEELSLNFIQLAYNNGCTLQGGTLESCTIKAQKYTKEIEEIFHNKIWEK